MVLVYDNWERLVRATLLREELRELATQPSSTSSDSSELIPSFNTIFLYFSKLGKSFEYEQICRATDDFTDKNLIKRGRSGDLFKGNLSPSTAVVVKRIDLLLISPAKYLSELEFYSKISHSGFVPLLGYCFEDEDIKYLVYESVPNGDLSSFSFTRPNGIVSLKLCSWGTRLQIAIGAAKGLVYLHHECNPPLVHGDVQASSILLDHNFNVQLGSLSQACDEENALLNRITRTCEGETSAGQRATGSWVSGVYCYGKALVKLARRGISALSDADAHSCAVPVSSYMLKMIYEGDTSARAIGSCKSDVYCFGKVLLELVTGKLGISALDDAMFQDWLHLLLLQIEDHETTIIDPSLLISDTSEFDHIWPWLILLYLASILFHLQGHK